ncbi:MAG: TIM barrel protein [Desulfobacterales bacterium]|jgi:sugar phosphate isomerase/epimerase
MLALSTSWQSGGAVTAEGMVAALKNLEITGIELSYRISEDLYREMKNPLERSGLDVVSVHNYFPIPSVKPESTGGGDLFLLSSLQKQERQNAVQFTAKTIEHAGELGAAAVVLHCGFVEMHHEVQVLYEYFNSNRLNSDEAQDFIHQKLKERDALKPKHMDSLLASLDNLATIAEKHRVLLGLENRYHYHELPGPDDFRLIFETFKGAPVGYWHDTGHAHANETLGLIPRDSLLQTYANRLIGVHLHDAVGLDDHIPPGSGEIGFKALKPFLKADTIRVIELKPKIPIPEVSDGIQFVKEQLLG